MSEQASPYGPDPGAAAIPDPPSGYPAPYSPTAAPEDPWRDPSTPTYTVQPITGPQPYATGPMYPGTPWAGQVAPTGKRRSGVAIALGIAAAFAVLCVAGAAVAIVVVDRQGKNTAGGSSGTTSHDAPSSAEPSASDFASAASPVLDGPTLLTKLTPAPAGARKVPLAGTSNGVMDLDQFVALVFSNRDTARQALESQDFRVAVEETWRNADGTSTDVQLVQFGTADDAQDFVQSQFDAFSADPDFTKDFDVPGITNGHGFVNMTTNKNGHHRTFLVGQHGSITVVMNFSSKAGFDQPAEIALITAQSQALP